MLAVALVAAAGALATPCEPAADRDPVLPLYRAGDAVGAQQLAMTMRALCPGSPATRRWRLVEALSLAQLEETARAQRMLRELADEAAGPEAAAAAVGLAWTHLRAGDDGAYAAALRGVPPDGALRLRLFASLDEDDAFHAALRAAPVDRGSVLQARGRYRAAARTKRPWLAGTLSALLPGAGQLYTGSPQAAAVAFVLSGVLVGATVELARHRLYFSSAAAGTAASIFYVGNIVNAVDLANRRNDAAAEPARDELERALLPELHP